MATYQSKQEKRQGLLDPLLVVLASVVLIGVLVMFGPFSGNAYNSAGNVLGTQIDVSRDFSLNDTVTFTSDARYWDANCSHGWGSDSVCNEIASRVQSCSINTASAYCSQYKDYLQQFR